MIRIGLPALVALSAATAAAQTTLSSQPPQTFRTGTLLVEVDTIVTDGKGQFVTGLTADDFEVLEDGKPQKIERVYVVTGTSVSMVSSAPAAQPASEPPAAAIAVPATAPPRVFVLLFDQEHLQEGAFKRLRDAAIEFLTNEFKPGDAGGVVIGNTMVGNQLTTDREALLAAVRNAKPSMVKTSRRVELLDWPRFNSEAEAVRIALSNDRNVLDQAVRRACQDDPDLCAKGVDPAPAIMDKARRVVGELRPASRRTVMTLQAVASGLGRLPGRKTVILMTEGFFVEESWADLRQIIGAAARSNVRIYSLDARGLDTRQVNDLRQLSTMDPGGGIPLEAYNTVEDGPNTLAVDTGGYPIRHTNKFAAALSEIARDTSNYYVIGYTPSNVTMDGSFRKIAVRVTRPGLKVRARRGYLATPPAVPATTAAAKPDDLASRSAGLSAVASAKAEGPAKPNSAKADTPVPAPATAKVDVTGDTTLPVSTGTSTSPAAPTPAAAGTPAAAVVLRPDSSDRVRALASRDGSETGKSFATEGWDRYQKGDLEGAAEWLGRAAADPAAHPWVRYALGYAALGLARPQQAAEEWERVRQAVPEFLPVYLDLADAYAQTQSYGRALETLRAAAIRWPADVEVLNAIGTIQVRRGALDEAIATFGKAAEAKPEDALAYFNLGRTYELRYFRMRRWIAYSPSEGRWLGNTADLKHAIASYEQYVKLGGPFETQARQALQNLQWLK
jgi:VWFA-related protein